MKTFLSRVPLAVCLLLLLGLPLNGALITDDFNDNVLNPDLWSPFTDGEATITETNQRLEITASDGGAVVRLRGLVIGDFDLRFDYTVLPAFDALDPDEDEPAIGVLYLGFDSFLIRTAGCIAAQGDDAIGESCYASTSALSGSLRVTRTGSQYEVYQLQDSVWTSLASGSGTETGPVDFYLGGATSGATPIWGAIDNFWLQADGFNAEVPEPASFALVGLGLVLAGVIRKRRQV